MTKEELSRKLAERFEPLISLPSDPKYWIAWCQLSQVTWQPRPYDDPEITMRLLKWLIHEHGAIKIGGPTPHMETYDIWLGRKRHYDYVDDTDIICDGPLTLAIAEAVAKARGLI